MAALSSGCDKHYHGEMDHGEMQLLVCGDKSRSPSNPFDMVANRDAVLNKKAKHFELSGLKTTSCLWEQRRHLSQKMHILKLLLLSPEVFISANVLLIV